jgi:type I restriction enzyme R subunit
MITEADTCRKYVLPKLHDAGWTDEHIQQEKSFTDGQIKVLGTSTRRGSAKRADYLLRLAQNYPIAVVEAKAAYKNAGDGLQQAKQYASMLGLRFAFSTNGYSIIGYDDISCIEQEVDKFPSPEELWLRLKQEEQIPDDVEQKLLEPLFHLSDKIPRYYQEIAINRAIREIYRGNRHILLTLASGTGKTFVAFQIIWKLWNQRWNRSGAYRRPKVLYLADRNVLIDDPKDKMFATFGDARWKVQGQVLKSRDIYFATYQAIARDERRPGLYKEFGKEFFDFIVVDECHRGSAREDSNWREILEFFNSATQLGMTATPLRQDNRDTYAYFGNPIYTYSLKQGIEDGFLAPYRVRRIVSSVDATGWRPYRDQRDRYDSKIPNGVYETPDFERLVSLKSRTEAVAHHLTDHLKSQNGRFEKTIVFCVDQEHADMMRRALHNANVDLIGKYPDYVVRITSEEGDTGRGFLDRFMDIEAATPVIATTSKLLTTGVDIQTCKNIALFSVINSMTEFKQIIGRGTRVREDYDKMFFTILDYTGSATKLFADPEFDGEPVLITETEIDIEGTTISEQEEETESEIVSTGGTGSGVVISNDSEGKIRKFYVDDVSVEIATELVYELDISGNRLRAIEYTDYTRDQVQKMFPSYDDIRSHWSFAKERNVIMESLEERGISFEHLLQTMKQPDADPFDLLCHVAYGTPIRTRQERAEKLSRNKTQFLTKYGKPAQEILREVLQKYVDYGIDQLGSTEVLKVPPISKHGNIIEIAQVFGGVPQLRIALSELQDAIYA